MWRNNTCKNTRGEYEMKPSRLDGEHLILYNMQQVCCSWLYTWNKHCYRCMLEKCRMLADCSVLHSLHTKHFWILWSQIKGDKFREKKLPYDLINCAYVNPNLPTTFWGFSVLKIWIWDYSDCESRQVISFGKRKVYSL